MSEITEEEVLDSLTCQDEFESEAMDYLPIVEEEPEDLGEVWEFGVNLKLEKVAIDRFILFILKGSEWEILEEFESIEEAQDFIERFKET